MKGPGTFPLERLLAIFQCITSVAEDPEDTNMQDNVLTSDMLLQLSTLCNANFVYKGGSCPLDGSTRYRCMVDEELAIKVTCFCTSNLIAKDCHWVDSNVNSAAYVVYRLQGP